MKENNVKIIPCPKCGYEYTAPEIFYGDELLGTPKNILRDGKHIRYYSGEEPQLEAEWECDNCKTSFKVEAELSFKTSIQMKMDFSEDYESIIHEGRIMFEESKLFGEDE